MMTIKPNFVLVEFGLIDESRHRRCIQDHAGGIRSRFEESSFRWFAISMELPSWSHRRLKKFTTSRGTWLQSNEDRLAAVRNVAAELQTPLIDLNKLSIDLLNRLGKSGSEYIWWSGPDYLHFSEKGAQVIAGLAVNALPDSLGPYLTGAVLDPPPKPDHDSHRGFVCSLRESAGSLTGAVELGEPIVGKRTSFQPPRPSPMSLSTNSHRTTFLFLRNAGRPRSSSRTSVDPPPSVDQRDQRLFEFFGQVRDETRRPRFVLLVDPHEAVAKHENLCVRASLYSSPLS